MVHADSDLRALIAQAKAQGFLTYDQVNEYLPNEAVTPEKLDNLLYALDINLRTSTILGIVGGGGIGFILFNALRVLQLRTVGAVLITIFVVVYSIELLSGWVRKKIL